VPCSSDCSPVKSVRLQLVERNRDKTSTRQDKTATTRQTRQDKTRHKTRQDKFKQDKTRQ
jgi:hypothetical protein